MREASEASGHDKYKILIWSCAFDKNNQPSIGLGATDMPDPLAIEDQLQEISFYWYADQHFLDEVKKYFVDSDGTMPTRLTELQPADGSAA
jgi:hypothetical protein